MVSPRSPSGSFFPLTPLREAEVVDAASRCASQAAPLDAAHVEDEKKPTERKPFQTSIIHAVPDAPHDPGPQPSPAHRLHGCSGPCDALRWEIGDRKGYSHCPICRTDKAHDPATERELARAGLGDQPPEQEAARQEASDARAVA